MPGYKATHPTILFAEPARSATILQPLLPGDELSGAAVAVKAADGEDWLEATYAPPGGDDLTGWVILSAMTPAPTGPSRLLDPAHFVSACMMAATAVNTEGDVNPWFAAGEFLIARAIIETSLSNLVGKTSADGVGPLQVGSRSWAAFLKSTLPFASTFNENDRSDPYLQTYAAAYEMYAEARAISEIRQKQGIDSADAPYVPIYLDIMISYILDYPLAAVGIRKELDAGGTISVADLLQSAAPARIANLFKYRGDFLDTFEASISVGEFVNRVEKALTGALLKASDLLKAKCPDLVPPAPKALPLKILPAVPTNVQPVPSSAPVPFAELPGNTSDLYWPVETKESLAMLISYTRTDGQIAGWPGRRFMADRRNGARHHVGVDLFCKRGDIVRACAKGKVVNYYPFYRANTGEQSYALLVEHDGVVVNYGEVRGRADVDFGWQIGGEVKAGQQIAKVSDTDMIHFETYVPGTKINYRWLTGNLCPKPLLNPTKLLLQLASGAKRYDAAGGVTQTAAVTTPDVNPPLNDENLITLARTVFGEARGEPPAGQIAVANVVLNRVKANRPQWGGSRIADVCRQPKQFSCWNASDTNFAKISHARPGIDPVFDRCYKLSFDVMSGLLADNTGEATHYFAKYINAPKWAAKLVFTCEIGMHRFYK